MCVCVCVGVCVLYVNILGNIFKRARTDFWHTFKCFKYSYQAQIVSFARG